jgi:uncharacterized protein YjiS (DUF1127 family)
MARDVEMSMTIFSNAISPGNSAAGALSRSIGAAFKRWWLAYMEWRLHRLTINLLRNMSDRQLKDIGLCRAEIEFVVARRAPRHPMLGRRRR